MWTVEGGGARGSTNMPWNKQVWPKGISKGLGVGGGVCSGVRVARAAMVSRTESPSCFWKIRSKVLSVSTIGEGGRGRAADPARTEETLAL